VISELFVKSCQILTYPTCIWQPHWPWPLWFCWDLWHQKTRVPGLSSDIVCV